MSVTAPHGIPCPRCQSYPCICYAPPVQPHVDPIALIRIAVALERIADALAATDTPATCFCGNPKGSEDCARIGTHIGATDTPAPTDEVPCPHCGGSGQQRNWADHSEKRRCPGCWGTGKIAPTEGGDVT